MPERCYRDAGKEYVSSQGTGTDTEREVLLCNN